MEFKLSPDQQKAHDSLIDWLDDFKKGKNATKQFITLGGYAGTGKTTLVSYLRKSIKKKFPKIKVSFCSFTGKATRVLRQKLAETETLLKGDNISTIHSLIYSPVTNSREEIVGWERKLEIEGDLIIVDEASMVDENIWNDLLSYKLPIIAIGDHGQLPPIRGNLNLMKSPIFKLEQIHRQAEGNPIIKISMLAREEGSIPVGSYGYNIMKISKTDENTREVISEIIEGFDPETLLLCGYNTTRVKLNKYVRQTRGFESLEPESGDRVICLRNNHSKGVFNGMLGTIQSLTKEGQIGLNGLSELYFANIQMDGESERFSGLMYPEQFNNSESINFTERRKEIGDADLFDFGYALTVHKSQGSQSRRVVLFEERFKQMDDENWRRWLYTAVTRAEEELFIVGQ